MVLRGLAWGCVLVGGCSAFESYDVENTGMIEMEELSYALADLGLLSGINSCVAASEIANTFQEIGIDNSGVINPEDFSILCLKLDRLKRNMSAPVSVPAQVWPVAEGRVYRITPLYSPPV